MRCVCFVWVLFLYGCHLVFIAVLVVIICILRAVVSSAWGGNIPGAQFHLCWSLSSWGQSALLRD